MRAVQRVALSFGLPLKTTDAAAPRRSRSRPTPLMHPWRLLPVSRALSPPGIRHSPCGLHLNTMARMASSHHHMERHGSLKALGSDSAQLSAMSNDPQMVFMGKWIRMASKSDGAVEYLMAHGMDRNEAQDRSNTKYEQEWLPTREEEGEWKVTTTSYKGTRSLVYPLGEWEEPFSGGSDLFGKEGGVVYRNTSWEETETLGYVHLTESATPLGWEATQRHVALEGTAGATGPVMVVKRIYTPRNEDGSAGDCITCMEYFERSMLWAPSA